MAVRHKSALKRARQNERRNARNRSLRSALRTVIKSFRAKVAAKDMQGAEQELPKVHQAIDKAVTKGVLHRNTASRGKSRAVAALKRAGAA
jgi:small subunit ribosomal protein S20